eukprot:7890984-Alexandrium_andersonii.AAC.1
MNTGGGSVVGGPRERVEGIGRVKNTTVVAVRCGVARWCVGAQSGARICRVRSRIKALWARGAKKLSLIHI